MDFSNLKNCSSALIGGFNKIYALNGFRLPDNKSCFNKYLPLSRLVNQVNTSSLAFVSPQKWADTFETRYYHQGGYQCKTSNFVLPEIFCMCLTSKHAENEDAMWRMYAQKGEQMVRAYYNIDSLLNILDSDAVLNGYKVYIGEIIYTDKATIKALTPTKSNVFFGQQFEIENYLSLMCLKRGAYRYENEIRIFIVPEAPLKDNTAPQGLFKVNHLPSRKYVGRVVLSPYPPLSASWPTPDTYTILQQKKAAAQTSLPGILINASRFHEKCPKCRF